MLLERLGQADEIDWARASLDSASVAAPGGPKDRPEPNRSRQTGLQAPCCGRSKGVPLAVVQTAANVHDSKALEEAVDAVWPIRKPRGRPRPRKRPEKLHADKGYDFPR